MIRHKFLSTLALVGALTAAPYSIDPAEGGQIREQSACAVVSEPVEGDDGGAPAAGLCPEMGCVGGPSDCFRTDKGTCTTTIRTD